MHGEGAAVYIRTIFSYGRHEVVGVGVFVKQAFGTRYCTNGLCVCILYLYMCFLFKVT